MSPAPRRHPTPISIASNTLLRNMPDATYKESPISNSNSSGNHQCEMGDPAAVAELSLAKWKLRKRWLTVCSAEDVEINQFNRIEEEVDDYIRKARVHDGISGSRRQSFLQPKATGTEEDPSRLPLSRPTDPHQEVSATSTRTNNNGDVTKSVDEEGISLLDVHETVDEAFLERKFPLMSLVNADSERLALPIRLTGVSGMSDEDTVGVERHTSHCPDQDIYGKSIPFKNS
ncbi:hypothetical protein DFJ73DRAFT_863063 [Zopfochytrium polystomum]|nr:hypothetical protein DFJ73DRAFT_863063 [Zopfochytrium polystomum]